jgi:predicted O-linked N-acetylglucosamine transferase (SPINDLY family)
MCKWDDLNFKIDQLRHSINSGLLSCPPFVLLSLIDDPDLHRKVANIFSSKLYPQKESFLEFDNNSTNNIVRIGYFSSDFFNHATSYLIAELLESHDFNKFEIYGFSYGPPIHDDMNHRLKQNFTEFYDISIKSDHDVAILSRNLKIDIAVDLKGFTQNSRTGIFTERCAPIQVNYLGYPGTMASSSYDYIISDINIIPEEYQKFYTESIIYMPHSYQVNDSKRLISEKIFRKYDFGLPDSGFIYCCFNNNYKITPDIFDLWMRALQEVPGSVLWLLEDNLVASQNLRIEADRMGVDSARLIFSKRIKLEDHLARHKLADLFIDTFPYNAHTTASDALWSGLPVVTLTGKSFASRVAASLLYALNLSELVTFNHEDYLAKLIDLGINPSKLMAINEKIHLIHSESSLFKGNIFARHIEAAYLNILKLYQSGNKPRHIFIQSLFV